MNPFFRALFFSSKANFQKLFVQNKKGFFHADRKVTIIGTKTDNECINAILKAVIFGVFKCIFEVFSDARFVAYTKATDSEFGKWGALPTEKKGSIEIKKRAVVRHLCGHNRQESCSNDGDTILDNNTIDVPSEFVCLHGRVGPSVLGKKFMGGLFAGAYRCQMKPFVILAFISPE